MNNKEFAKIDLKKVSEVVKEKTDEIEKPIYSYCQKSKVMGFTEFEVKIKEIIAKEVAKIPPGSSNPSIKEFQDLFASFDEMPPNLNLPKRKTDSLKRSDSFSQLNSTVFFAQPPPSPPRRPDPIPKHFKKATMVLKEFIKFKELQTEVQQRSTDLEPGLANYVDDLKDLQKFSTDLNHFLHNIESIEDAFTAEEQLQIKDFETAFKQLTYIIENNKYTNSSVDASEKFKYLVEVINDLHKDITHV